MLQLQPRIEKWQNKYSFQLVIVSTDTPGELKDFMEKNHIQAVVLVDSQMQADRLYQIQAIPSDFLLDKQGMIQQSFLGWSGANSLKAMEDWLTK